MKQNEKKMEHFEAQIRNGRMMLKNAYCDLGGQKMKVKSLTLADTGRNVNVFRLL